MTRYFKKFLSFLIVIMLITLSFPVSANVFAEEGTSTLEFNLFRDAGEITDEYISETNRLSKKNWNDYYFSSIVMTFGDTTVLVDGKEVETDHPATVDDDGEIILPAMDIAKVLGAEASIDVETGNIKIEDKNKNANLDIIANDILIHAEDAMELEKNNALNINRIDTTTVSSKCEKCYCVGRQHNNKVYGRWKYYHSNAYRHRNTGRRVIWLRDN